VTAAVVAGLLGALLAPAHARAGVWTAPLGVGAADPGLPVGRDVAMDASGAAGLVWTSGGTVRVTLRRAGGGFGSTQTLGSGAAGSPAIALDGTGRALAVWSRGGTLAAAAGTAAAGLNDIPDLATGVVGDPGVAFVSGGRAIVVWAGTDGAIHALERDANGVATTVGALSTGVGNANPAIAAAGDRAVVAWIATATAAGTRTTRLLAAMRPPGGGFSAPEEIASRSVDGVDQANQAGTDITNPHATISEAGAADVEATLVHFIGLPGDFGLESVVFTHPPVGTWGLPQILASFDARLSTAPLTTDLVAGRAGDALYVSGEARGSMQFNGRLRPPLAVSFGGPVPVVDGPAGEIRAAALATGRFLALLRSGGAVRSYAQTGAAGFGTPLDIVGSGAAELLGAAGAARGEAVAAWRLTTGAVQVALYDDAAAAAGAPQGRPPAPGADRTRPVLSQLRVSPSRFAARRGRGRSARGGSTVRWRVSEAATVRLRVQRVRSGFRSGGRCVARRPRRGTVRRCTRFVTVLTLTRRAAAGRTAMRFAGLVRGRALGPGRYRLEGRATDAARNASLPRRASFTIVRR
jgi:hypothetical protein